MAKAAHSEFHFLASDTVRDVVIGMSDGLTVPFALAAGLTGAAVGGGVIVTAGLAEIAAGAVAMGLGGYLAAAPRPSITAPNTEGSCARPRKRRMRSGGRCG